MKTSLIYLALFLICFQLVSCAEDDNLPTAELEVVIDSDTYTATLSDNYIIRSMKIDGDFLIIKFSSSGCSGESWKAKLIDSGSVAYSNPPQRLLILSLENNELCEALITKELVFDISALRVGSNSVWLNLKNYGEPILYQY